MQTGNRLIITPDEISQIRKKLRRGDSELIAEMLCGLYRPLTISKMIRGHRTMKPLVYKAAVKLLTTIENLKNELK